MYARLTLLTLVTALFMGAWNSDQAQIQAAIARRELRRETLIAQRNSSMTHPSASQQAGESADREAIREGITMSSKDSTVPLPADIAPGQYRAVNNNGVVQTISVAARDEITESSRDFYMVDATADERWYLIRVQ